MVLVEHLLRVAEVQRVLGDDVPGQFRDKLEVAARHLVVRSVRRHATEALEFAFDLLLRGFGQVRLTQLVLDLGEILVAVFLAECLLDGAFLLAQQLFALLLVDVPARLRRDLLAQLHHRSLVGQLPEHHFEEYARRLDRQDLLLGFEFDALLREACDAVHLGDGVVVRAHELREYLVAVLVVDEVGDAPCHFERLGQQGVDLRLFGLADIGGQGGKFLVGPPQGIRRAARVRRGARD